MRIVSLLPSATEIVCALGLADDLVGVSHECDFPPDAVAGKAVVTSSFIRSEPDEAATPDDDTDEGADTADAGDEDDEGDEEAVTLLPTARAIDAQVRAALENGESLYRIDHDALRDLRPDVVLTQGLCDVCAVNHASVKAAVDALGSSVTVVDLAPTTLASVLESFRQVGAATNRVAEAETLAQSVQARWDAVRDKAALAPETPRTLLLEWTDPPFSAGHWNPELLALANAQLAPWDKTGEPSQTLSWDEITAWTPEVIVLVACGFDAERAVLEASVLPSLVPGWFDLPAVRNAECYAVDGNAYFNRPGPRLAESAEILAILLHPETIPEMVPPYAVRLFPVELLTPAENDETEGDAAEPADPQPWKTKRNARRNNPS